MLSVIVPVYQSASCLERCIRSIVSCSCQDLELILVDDGSTDGSSGICDDIAANDNRVKVIHQQNRGLSAARNAGIEAADGDYLTFIDSDDEISQDALAANSQYLAVHQEIDLIEYPVSVHHGSPRQYNLSFTERTVCGRDILRDWISSEGYTHSYAWNKIYRRDLFEGIRFPQGETFEDMAVIVPVLRRCEAVRYSDKGLYLYHDNPDGITRHYSFRNQEPLFRHNLEILKMASGMQPRIPTARIWLECFNTLVILSTCSHSESQYIEDAGMGLESLVPAIKDVLYSRCGIKGTLKYLTVRIAGSARAIRIFKGRII